MMRRCVIERWVQRKTDQKLIFNGNYTQIVFFVFRIHFHYVLSYLFGLFGVRTCVSILWHTSLPKNATFAWKNSEKPWFFAIFGDFRVFDMTSLMISLWRHTRYVCTFFGTNGLGRVIAIHWYHTLDVSSIGFRDLGVEPPQLWDGSKKPCSFRVKLKENFWRGFCTLACTALELFQKDKGESIQHSHDSGDKAVNCHTTSCRG